jgi:hypothetical protein
VLILPIIVLQRKNKHFLVRKINFEFQDVLKLMKL